MKKVLLFVACAVVLFANVSHAGTIDIVSPVVILREDEAMACIAMNLNPSPLYIEIYVGNTNDTPTFGTQYWNQGEIIGQYRQEYMAIVGADVPNEPLFCVFRVDQTAKIRAGMQIYGGTPTALRSYVVVK